MFLFDFSYGLLFFFGNKCDHFSLIHSVKLFRFWETRKVLGRNKKKKALKQQTKLVQVWRSFLYAAYKSRVKNNAKEEKKLMAGLELLSNVELKMWFETKNKFIVNETFMEYSQIIYLSKTINCCYNQKYVIQMHYKVQTIIIYIQHSRTKNTQNWLFGKFLLLSVSIAKKKTIKCIGDICKARTHSQL